MSVFARALAQAQPGDRGGRQWIYVPYDQLTDEVGPLAKADPTDLGVVLVESTWKPAQRSYHKQKLALVLSNQRHFALEQAQRGVAVEYLFTDQPYGTALRSFAKEYAPLRTMRPAERELRVGLRALADEGLLEVLPHAGWLTTRDQFEASQADGPPFRMDAFYRHVRRDTGILMENGKPVGGKYSFDAENRQPWKGEPPAPTPPTFQPDDVTQEVVDLVSDRFDHHPGTVRPEHLAATRDQVDALLAWALDACLPEFGPYEDAMSARSRSLFHTRLSAWINLHRLTPARVLEAVLERDIPHASLEGFVRQLIGWREFVRHVHDATDGFRSIPDPAPSGLGAADPLPDCYWEVPEAGGSGLACLDRVVREVWDGGYTHHIPRLMVLSNLATLLDISPRELTDWFWIAFTDAYDWVVEPNVLAMGTYGVGGVMTTKPYVSGAAYIHRMSDYCSECAFDPKGDCPVTPMYWSFLDRKRSHLEGNHRMRLPLSSEAKRSDEQRRQDRIVTRAVRAALQEGETMTPDKLTKAVADA